MAVGIVMGTLNLLRYAPEIVIAFSIMQLIFLWPFSYWYLKKSFKESFFLAVVLSFIATVVGVLAEHTMYELFLLLLMQLIWLWPFSYWYLKKSFKESFFLAVVFSFIATGVVLLENVVFFGM